ncbi:hypothetical protein WUBG_11607 [Wuchereria bancrofti]|uniref:Uncharacterized protein n=1 Tax=Wuchereria bancrofti TaxID=6293 RepID=J9EQD3_WUCBA|nr:hypothetical protein WUBG_11607 [Wuchereria bancrofti]
MYIYGEQYHGYYYHYAPYGGGLLFIIMILLICCCCMLSAAEIPPYGYYYDCICCGPCINCHPFHRHQHNLNPVFIMQIKRIVRSIQFNEEQKKGKKPEINFIILGQIP